MSRLWKSLWAQVLLAAVLGAALGLAWPQGALKLQPLGDAFIRLVRMIIAPIVFVTVVGGIARVGGLTKTWRVAWRAFLTFEALTTAALLLGLAAGLLLEPGAGLGIDTAAVDTRAIAGYTAAGKALNWPDFLMGLIPKDVVDAFAKDDVLQVVFFSLLFGVALAALRAGGREVLGFVEDLSAMLFRILAMVMRVAPLGAFGAMAFSVARFGPGTLIGLGRLVAIFYGLCALLVLVVFGLVLRWCGIGLPAFLRYLRREILLVLGTSSSEPALPLLMDKVAHLGCSRPVTGLVVPLGYAFNLVGSAAYLTLATAFIAQATGTPVSPWKWAEILLVLLVTSKTATAVTGGGFVALSATLTAVGDLPLAGLTILLGVDRAMSEARAITNLIGNGVAAVAVSRWEGELDLGRARAALADPAAVEAEIDRAGHIDPRSAVPDAPALHG